MNHKERIYIPRRLRRETWTGTSYFKFTKWVIFPLLIVAGLIAIFYYSRARGY
jgi:hypothetical protein